MEYIKNLLKELIGVMFLCTVLYVLTPRFIKVAIKSITKALFKIACLAMKLVKRIVYAITVVVKGIWNAVLVEYNINIDSKKERATVETETPSDNVIPFSKKTANTKR